MDLSEIPEKLRPRFASLYNQNIELREELNYLKRIVYASKSERYEVQEYVLPQGTLFNEAEVLSKETINDELEESSDEIENNDKDKKSKKIPKNKNRFPENLPRQIKVHDIPENEKTCPYDGTRLVEIKEDVVEKLSVIPATLKVIEHRYKKYACPCCTKSILKAKSEPSILPGSLAEPELFAHIVVYKYLFALPLYRQETLLKQKNIEIPRATLARWVIAAGEAVMPVVSLMKNNILENEVIHCDETPI